MPPRFVEPPEDSTVVMNQTILISCLAEGRPQPHVFWKKATGPGASNFQDLPIDQRFQVSRGLCDTKLYLISVIDVVSI